ncbi:MAG TPA: hypothetical protein VHN20_01500 [Beijerinckiaceae bacterium]|nr:hypothetical protein [Beijerinckiaceae bacterium]
MPLTKDIDPVHSSQDFPHELRRTLSSHQIDEPATTAMVSGVIGEPHDDDPICPSYMLWQNLVMPAYPFRAPALSSTQPPL